MDADEKLDIIKELYDYCVAYTNSFEDDRIGADFAYLIGAIINDNFCSWSADRPIVKLIRDSKILNVRLALDYIAVEE